MTREELFQTVELLRDTAKLHKPNEEILTDIKAESFFFVMDSVLSALSVPEREKGEWIEKEGYDGDTYYDCSVCGNSWTTIEGTPWDNGMDFCPNCGAEMHC